MIPILSNDDGPESLDLLTVNFYRGLLLLLESKIVPYISIRLLNPVSDELKRNRNKILTSPSSQSSKEFIVECSNSLIVNIHSPMF